MRRVWSYVRAMHMPVPYRDPNGRWRCRDCGRLLTRYLDEGRRSLRHHPRGKA